MEVEESTAGASKTAVPHILVKIVSAEYGPCEGRRLLTSDRTTDDPQSSVPYTRDVAPFLRALLLVRHRGHDYGNNKMELEQTEPTNREHLNPPTVIRVSGVTRSGMKRSSIPVMDHMKGMNAIFGDPCPGVTKSLRVSYIASEVLDDHHDAQQWAASAQIHRVSFAEHEKVWLHHRVRQQSALEQSDHTSAVNQGEMPNSPQSPGQAQAPAERESLQWRLQTDVSEVVLPMVMDYLSIAERVHARIVCRDWRRIIRDWGVATVIDNNDPQLLGLTRPFLKGLLKHSYSSLQSLSLSGFEDLRKEDLECIQHLRKLRSLDVSRCIQLDDSTLSLLADHCSETLEVLYIKGLRKVTDAGMLAICNKCTRLRVLDISNIPITDVSGVSIGRQLINLNAIYTRDNFRLTTESVTAITNHCLNLEQLTLWGCTKLQQLQFATACREKLFLLNLWGCHGLRDDAAAALEGMVCLRTLIVSECHCLTDTFFVR